MNVGKQLISGIGSGVGVGAGLGVVFAAVTIARGGDARPMLRGAVKAAVAAVETGRRLVAEAAEEAQDLYHEAQAERAVERSAREAHESANGSAGTTIVLPRAR